MTIIHNHTGVPHFWFEKSGPEGEPLDILIVRATFDFAIDGKAVTLAKLQSPINLGDTFAGPVEANPLHAVVIEDGDLLPYKPGTDILVLGHAHAPNNQTQTDWLAGIRVGTIKKMLHLYGPRQFRKNLLGWSLDKASPVLRVALDYRLAYGGCIAIPADLSADQEPDAVSYPNNPAGCGWLPDSAALKHLAKPARRYVDAWISAQKILPAPQIEAITTPVTHPYQNCAPVGLSPLARWWSPRVAYQGKYDEQWRTTRAPLLPIDFDTRYYQSATPEMVATPHLSGHESVSMIGLLPANTEMCLPGWNIIAAIQHASGTHTVSLPVLDTLRFNLDSRQVVLVWRCHFNRDDPVTEISLAASSAKITGETIGNSTAVARSRA